MKVKRANPKSYHQKKKCFSLLFFNDLNLLWQSLHAISKLNHYVVCMHAKLLQSFLTV